MAGERDDMDRLIDRGEAQEEALWSLFYLLDAVDLADFPEEIYWELYSVHNKMVVDYKSRFPNHGNLPPEGQRPEDR